MCVTTMARSTLRWMMPLLLPLLALMATLAATGLDAAPADASARREHGRHGIQRRVCASTAVRRWPGGPPVGTVPRGADFHRYDTRGRWSLGVTVGAPQRLRGYVLNTRFCPPSARGRRALVRARTLAARVLPGRPGRPLARPLLRRVCASAVYVRDRPLNRAIGLLYAGDSFEVRRHARTPYAGGLARGHVRRRGWVPRSALCRGLGRARPGYAAAAGPASARVLSPPPVVACRTRIAGNRLLQVGVRFPAGRRHGQVVVRLVDAGGRTAGVPVVFTPRGRTAFAYAPLGPFRCGREYTVRYDAGGERAGFGVRIASRRGPREAAAAVPAATAARRCPQSPSQKAYAHGGAGPVDHRYHARPAISADGGTVAFEALAAGQVVVRDVAGGSSTVASARADGTPGNARSRAPAMSGDGRVVAFESLATNLAASAAGRAVFVRRGGQLRRVGPGRTPALSGDGSVLAYEAGREIRVVDLRTGASEHAVTRGYRPALNADGRFLAFETQRDDLAGGSRDRNRDWDVVRLDLRTGRRVLVSAGPAGATRHGASLAPSLSADGSRVAFQSEARLTPRDRLGLRDVFVRDVARGTITMVSVTRCGRPGNGYSRYPSISADGRVVAFDSHAADLVSSAPRGRGQVYVRDLAARRTVAASRRPDGRPSARTSFSPALAARGLVVAFPAFSYDLGPLDLNHRVDTYVRALRPPKTRRLG